MHGHEPAHCAERDLQDKLNFLILKSGFIKKLEKKTDPIHYSRFEKRIYGRSQKPRDKLIIYEVITDEFKNKYWDLISKYNELNKKHEKISKNIKKQYNLIEKAETQKEIKSFEKNIRAFLKDIDGLRKQKDDIRTDLDKMINGSKEGLHELKKGIPARFSSHHRLGNRGTCVGEMGASCRNHFRRIVVGPTGSGQLLPSEVVPRRCHQSDSGTSNTLREHQIFSSAV